MIYFRCLLALLTALIWVYTLVTLTGHGLDFVNPFLSALQALDWAGQFNFDFLTYLILSAVWVAWRGCFSAASNCAALAALALGMSFFAPYLLYLSYRHDLPELLLGEHLQR